MNTWDGYNVVLHEVHMCRLPPHVGMHFIGMMQRVDDLFVLRLQLGLYQIRSPWGHDEAQGR